MASLNRNVASTQSEAPRSKQPTLDEGKVETKVLSFLKAENLEDHPTIVSRNN